MWSPKRKKLEMPSAHEALPGRATRMRVPPVHFVNGHRLEPPFPAGMKVAMFGLGCFWAPRSGSGPSPACTARRSATRAVSRRIPPTKRSARGSRATTRSCAWSTIRKAAEASRETHGAQLARGGYGAITTETLPAPEFYYAEDYHQQYLAKHPDGYCGLGACGIAYNAGNA
jgi:peptide-methionine (S)-S-oxide reductase